MVTILDGDADYELIIKGVATVTINGGSAATEWSRLFQAGESATFQATSATNWQVSDGRIPCAAHMYMNADQPHNDATTVTNIPYQATAYNDGMTFTTGVVNTDNPPTPTAGALTVRRAGKYSIRQGCSVSASNVTADNYYNARVKVAGTTVALNRVFPAVGTTLLNIHNCIDVNAAVGAAITGQFSSAEADIGTGGGAIYEQFLSVHEIL